MYVSLISIVINFKVNTLWLIDFFYPWETFPLFAQRDVEGLEGSEIANSAILDGKKLFKSNQVFRLGSENSKSVILDVKQLFS